ncbi:putative alpha-L-arabinofuranosidase A [Favolaschia claudopus]|uniref:non-reducing end alpha-L-arabinofuranosidase n=1 Tax=Favolaschia claudopus TaxID=2862362 RepID=A0AAW0D6C5_9AGAR
MLISAFELWGFASIALVVQAVTVTVSPTASHPVPTTLYTTAALNAWHSINGAAPSVVADILPVSSALPNSLQVTIPAGSTGPVGVGNEGYFGIKVTAGSTYTASFHYRFAKASSFKGSFKVALQTATGRSLVSTSVTVTGETTKWQEVKVTLRPTISASSIANNFTVTLDGSAASGQIVHFALFSLFPPTFKNRPNGMRVDIATTLAEMHPSFFRLPVSHCFLFSQGQTVDQRWQWNATVGPLLNRPGRIGHWGYINTDGLGLMDYLNWCEDLGMQAIMAIWSGFALGGTSVAEADLGPYIQQAMDQINFVIGDSKMSVPAALRASLGHPDPYPLAYVEVGNEDFFAASTYTYRWHDFVSALQPKFPNLRFIATSNTFNPILSPNPQSWDQHNYNTPSWFAENSFFYDGFERNGTTYFEGEYAAISTNSSDIFGTPATGRLTFPTMQSASGEAAYMTGLERNADIVFSASYAPLLNHVANSQWTPNLISFDAGNVYPSTSYYVQKLFSLNRGDEYLPSTLPVQNGTLFWSVVRKISTQQIIIKISNTVESAADLTFELPFRSVAKTGTAQVLTGAANASNTPTTPNLVVPKNSTIATGKRFSYIAPGFSVSVLSFIAH